jgi:hypothetical protein
MWSFNVPVVVVVVVDVDVDGFRYEQPVGTRPERELK